VGSSKVVIALAACLEAKRKSRLKHQRFAHHFQREGRRTESLQARVTCAWHVATRAKEVPWREMSCPSFPHLLDADFPYRCCNELLDSSLLGLWRLHEGPQQVSIVRHR